MAEADSKTVEMNIVQEGGTGGGPAPTEQEHGQHGQEQQQIPMQQMQMPPQMVAQPPLRYVGPQIHFRGYFIALIILSALEIVFDFFALLAGFPGAILALILGALGVADLTSCLSDQALFNFHVRNLAIAAAVLILCGAVITVIILSLEFSDNGTVYVGGLAFYIWSLDVALQVTIGVMCSIIAHKTPVEKGNGCCGGPEVPEYYPPNIVLQTPPPQQQPQQPPAQV